MAGLSGAAIIGALLVGTSAASGTAALASAPGGQALAKTQTVQLITGDTVRLRTDATGRQTVEIIKALHSGPGSVFRSYISGGDRYVVPQSAVPYLGSTLDPGLFDVTRLARHAGTSLSVHVTTRAGGSAALPGLRLRAGSDGTMTGSFSAASAKAFGRALAGQSMRDHASATHVTGIFRTVAKVAPSSGSAPSRPASPADSVLTIKGINWAGDPDNGDSYNIYNVDDINLFATTITFQGGTAQVTVPDGHYAAVGFFYDFSTGTIYQNTLAQFTVSGKTTVTIDARDATSAASITTPKDSVTFSNAMGIGRADANGLLGSYSFTAGDQKFYVKPIKKAPSVGKLYYWFYNRSFSAAGKAAKPYSYDLKYGSTGTIAADQSYTPTQASLAGIKAMYGADKSGQRSLDARFVAFPWEQFIIASDAEHTAPLTRMEYYTADKNLYNAGVDYQVYVPDPFTLTGEIDSSWRTYKAGYSATQPWGDDPAHPRLLEHDVYLNQTVCPACISGTTLDGLAFPFGDGSPEHRTYPDQPTAGLSETSNWSVTADGDIAQQGTGVLVAAAGVGSANEYGINYTTTRSSADFTLSTKSSTKWTVPAGAPTGDLPKGWTCTLSGGTNCKVLELMTASYDLPSDSLGRIASGDVSGTFTIGHLADGAFKVKSLKVKVSFDGGKTYSDATVASSGGGAFTVDFTVPPKGQTDGFGALWVSAKDSIKGSFQEKITNAFGVK